MLYFYFCPFWILCSVVTFNKSPWLCYYFCLNNDLSKKFKNTDINILKSYRWHTYICMHIHTYIHSCLYLYHIQCFLSVGEDPYFHLVLFSLALGVTFNISCYAHLLMIRFITISIYEKVFHVYFWKIFSLDA